VPSTSDPSFADPKLCVKSIPTFAVASSNRIADFAAGVRDAGTPRGCEGGGATCPIAVEANPRTSNSRSCI
jgi:hypothetical protein